LFKLIYFVKKVKGGTQGYLVAKITAFGKIGGEGIRSSAVTRDDRLILLAEPGAAAGQIIIDDALIHISGRGVCLGCLGKLLFDVLACFAQPIRQSLASRFFSFCGRFGLLLASLGNDRFQFVHTLDQFGCGEAMLRQFGFKHRQLPLLGLHLPDGVPRGRFIALCQRIISLLIPTGDLLAQHFHILQLPVFIVEGVVNLLAQRFNVAVDIFTKPYFPARRTSPRFIAQNVVYAGTYQHIEFSK
jgi:hypothetical protein